MGTNYYWTGNVCETCKRGDDEIHIGKSSGGWTFALHIHPHDGVNDLSDWKGKLKTGEIRNEYNDKFTYGEILKIITERNWKARDPNEAPKLYSSWWEFHNLNHSEFGPNNLLRRKIDYSNTIGHGEGTWDLCIGEFS